MSYKTILVHVDESRQLGKRVELAARLAAHAHAHLVGVAATGVARALHWPVVAGPDGASMAPYQDAYLDTLRRRAAAALDQFDMLARGAGAASREKRLVDDDAAIAVSGQGRYADLIVLGQGDPGDPALTARVDFPEYVILNSECPVLVLPCAGRVFSIGERVLIAWNGGMAASRAVRGAMPFLAQARSVQVAVIDAPAPADPGGAQSGAELLAYLARHGVKAEVIARASQGDPGHALLALAADLTCDLLVMGCVAHPRSRGALLGGATRVVLESSTVAVLMSH